MAVDEVEQFHFAAGFALGVLVYMCSMGRKRREKGKGDIQNEQALTGTLEQTWLRLCLVD